VAYKAETDTNVNLDISAVTEIASYTATATRFVVARVLLDQVAGNGDYVIYATLQVGGSGSAYRILPQTTGSAASDLTAIGFVSIGIPVDNTDVVKIYVDGLAGDTATPDTRVDWYVYDYLRPTVTGRTLDVAADGNLGDARLAYLDAAVSSRQAASSGASSKVYTVTVDGLPAAGVYCRMTSDISGSVNVDAGTSDSSGNVTFHHDLAAGTTVYIWRSKTGVEFSDPDTETI